MDNIELAALSVAVGNKQKGWWNVVVVLWKQSDEIIDTITRKKE